MSSSTPPLRTGSRQSGGGGGHRPGLGSVGSVSLTPLSTAAPSTSTADGAAFFAALPSCLMPEALDGERDFEDYLQQFRSAARLSGWQTATTDNRPYYFALRLRGNAPNSYTTLTVAQQQNSDQLVTTFRTTHTKLLKFLKKTEGCSAATKPNISRVSL